MLATTTGSGHIGGRQCQEGQGGTFSGEVRSQNRLEVVTEEQVGRQGNQTGARGENSGIWCFGGMTPL